jgi:LAS superfamily LD-carboxypeptidase LdcB
MNLRCDNCKNTNKGRYSTFFLEGKLITLCNECRYGIPKNKKSPETIFNELQTPFWKLMGAKPKPQDIALEKYLHRRGMTYGDWRKEREAGLAKNPSALNAFEQHIKQYGTNNAPNPSFRKTS